MADLECNCCSVALSPSELEEGGGAAVFQEGRGVWLIGSGLGRRCTVAFRLHVYSCWLLAGSTGTAAIRHNENGLQERHAVIHPDVNYTSVLLIYSLQT